MIIYVHYVHDDRLMLCLYFNNMLVLVLTFSGPHRGLKDEDNESGRGASLPQSPVSVDSDHGQQRDYLKTYKHDQRFASYDCDSKFSVTSVVTLVGAML